MRKSKHFALAAGLGIAVTAMLAGFLPGCGSADSQADLKPLAVGSVVPDFKLTDVTGTEHTLAQYKGKVVALVFTSQECPYSRGADPQLADIARKYAEKGVVVLSIDSHKDTTPEQIRQYRDDKQLPFPILKDPGNKYADAVGAKQTPEVFLVDKKGKLAYHGAFDDRRGTDEPGETPYLANAIEALLADKTPDPADTRQWGCSIKRAS
ncbi:MAG: redoxin domain-containing protein [Candidatus Hydrogenedentes bacterium]|nr:redoxin domain-containing protein [Candidatus Hydrogenedentota bacterium]